MAELRQNLATGEWVIIANERARRPEEFMQPPSHRGEVPTHSPRCPFCPGNEAQSTAVDRWPAEGDWAVRAVLNKFPALDPHGGPRLETGQGVLRRMSGVGHHEVIIETPIHNQWPALQSEAQVLGVLRALRDRGRRLRHDERVEQVVLFKNHGATAGTSLTHPHAQLIGLPVIPSDHEARQQRAWRFFDRHGECVYCRMLAEELLDGRRLVVESARFVCFVPFAAFSPFHLWIVPRRHSSDFLDVDDEVLAELARVLRQVLRRLYLGLGDPDFNYVIQTAPLRMGAQGYLHWYLAVIPRLSRAAGFELGSGMFINTAVPEESARFLRAVVDPEGDG